MAPSTRKGRKGRKGRRQGREAKRPFTIDHGDDERGFVSGSESLFVPRGQFRTYETMNRPYRVEPHRQWVTMKGYKSFVLHRVKYPVGSFFYVANQSSIKRQRAISNDEPMQSDKINDHWVAYILEIRASDKHHVYARIYWMYWPDELPRDTCDGRSKARGRRPYHGVNELIASNHMDIIDVRSVVARADVKQWNEQDDDEEHCTLYWRQGLDLRTYELSMAHPVCSCNTPANPDKMLLQCHIQTCQTWMHEECLIEKALEKYDPGFRAIMGVQGHFETSLEVNPGQSPMLRLTWYNGLSNPVWR